MTVDEGEFQWATRVWVCPKDGNPLLEEYADQYDLRCEDCGMVFMELGENTAKRVRIADE